MVPLAEHPPGLGGPLQRPELVAQGLDLVRNAIRPASRPLRCHFVLGGHLQKSRIRFLNKYFEMRNRVIVSYSCKFNLALFYYYKVFFVLPNNINKFPFYVKWREAKRQV